MRSRFVCGRCRKKTGLEVGFAIEVGVPEVNGVSVHVDAKHGCGVEHGRLLLFSCAKSNLQRHSTIGAAEALIIFVYHSLE